MGYMYALSWKLLIRVLLLEYFATLLKILQLKKIAKKCSIFLHQLYCFLMGRSRTFLGDKDQISSGKAKGRGMGGWWEMPKVRIICAKFPLLSKIQTLSQKLLVRQTSNYHHCDQHAPKLKCRDFQVI